MNKIRTKDEITTLNYKIGDVNEENIDFGKHTI